MFISMPKRGRKLPEPPPTADNPAQSRAFIRKAREVEVDEAPGAMDRAFEQITGRRRKTSKVAEPRDPPERGRKRKSD